MMKLDYTVANVNIRFESELHIAENGYAPRFRGVFVCPDFLYRVIPCREVPHGFSLPGNGNSKAVDHEGCRSMVTQFQKLDNEYKPYFQLVYESGSNNADIFLTDDCSSWSADMYYILAAAYLSIPLIRRNAFIIHAAFLNMGGSGIVISGPSGVGKTTLAKLMENNADCIIVNGDRAVIEIKETGIFASGIPIAGTSGICNNVELPLKAIVFPEKGENSFLLRLGGRAAVMKMAQNSVGAAIDTEASALVCEQIAAVANSVPIYAFPFIPDEAAAITLKKEFAENGVIYG